ncbi:6,7-dimethyl-8-ribityllumazine synthase [Acidipila sp. EB88]|uniref:6,7-dimethyl-8-ribityllumazine synthase n=1 Tax=Acidipila sp. EB88 TaxID=2305226 RepID=UPI000F5ED786|nr:6,7-dimethyl-8-ribityllumazine synthase [Acidipila sp. EB88]RRA48694.1 6,7-dimethyl-8-ribityllumazine synthase [Acidipila sp. EB88]
MIKGLTLLRSASTPAAFDRLGSFFAALGFEPGPGWVNGANRGSSFRAPLATIEWIDGAADTPADLLIEVTSLGAVRDAAEAWLRAHAAEGATEAETLQSLQATLSRIEPTVWKTELFTAEPVPGIRIAFWEWAEPLKGKPAAMEGDLVVTGMRFAIVVARWNAVITDRLLQGSLDALLRSGARREDIEIVRVPGAWEIPDAARTLAETGRIDGIITLGVLLRGETAHYEAIYNEVSRGIGQSQQETGIPHAFGVLTCETLEQALDRAGLKAGNKGFEAASAAIEMVSLKRKIKAAPVQGSAL